jgi:hypothetical protein
MSAAKKKRQAEKTVTLTIASGEVRPAEGLCTTCWNPSLVIWSIYALMGSGPIEIATKTICVDCYEKDTV